MQTDVGAEVRGGGWVVASYLYAARYEYSEAAWNNDNTLRLTPREDAGQRLLSHELWTRPSSTVVSYGDRFGNRVSRARVADRHEELIVGASGRVELSAEEPRSSRSSLEDAREQSEAFEYTAATPLVDPGALRELAERVSAEVDGAEGASEGSLAATVRAITMWVHDQIAYLRGTTDVGTTASEALAAGEGVCQDKAHLALGMLRSLGAPCRYVSGMMTGEVGETHAWLEFLDPEAGWLGADPTRGVVLPPSRDYVTLAVGLDYSDVSPINGTFLSKGDSRTVAAIVEVKMGAVSYTEADALALLADAYVVED